MKNFAYQTLYTKDEPLFEVKVFLFFLYSLIFSSNVLLQFKSMNASIGAIVVMILPFVFIITGVYYYNKILIRFELNVIDVLVLITFFFPIYNGIMSYLTLGVPIKKMLMVLSARMYIVLTSFTYYLVRTKKLTVKEYVYGNILLCWFSMLLYMYISLTQNPALYKDSLEEGLVGYNPSKGGYIFRFSSSFLYFGIIYYYLSYILNGSFFGLLCWFVLIAYQLFIDKGRSELIAELIPLMLYSVIILKWHQLIKKMLLIFLLAAIMFGIAYWIDPRIVQFTADMYMKFFEFFIGKKTGEGSADMRWIEFGHIYDYFIKHPGQIFFGIGTPKKEDMYRYVGEVILSDTGIVGCVLANGIVGTILLHLLLLHPVYVFFKVKHYKHDILFNTGILGCLTVVIQSMFTGMFYYNPNALMIFIIIVEYYRVKEKFYWKSHPKLNIST